MPLEQQIVIALEQTFIDKGFASPSVADLKQAANVSLRTLYRYYPSKEAMIVASLNYRHQRYLQLLEADILTTTNNQTKSASTTFIQQAIITAMFNNLAKWMQTSSVKGCLFLHALAAYPDTQSIIDCVIHHKQQVRLLLESHISDSSLAQSLFILLEGGSCAWPILGQQAIDHAQQAATLLCQTSTEQPLSPLL